MDKCEKCGAELKDDNKCNCGSSCKCCTGCCGTKEDKGGCGCCQ